MIEQIRDLVNADEELVRRGRFVSTTFLLEIGEQGYLVKIIEGRIVSITPGPFVTPNYSFALRAPPSAPSIVTSAGVTHSPFSLA